VAKNGVFPPPEVLNLVQWIDQKCYRIDPPIPLGIPLVLDHLNPVLRELGAPPEYVRVMEPLQLCVPVAKNGVFPPEDVLPLVQWIDQKCYRIFPPIPLNIPLQLDHLNPVLVEMGLPSEQVLLQEPEKLCVPVAKNEVFPPE